MRNVFSATLYDCACENEDIYIVVADISPAGSMAQFSSEYPERFINVGVAEQCMIGMCAGLALKGCQPFAYTIATFSLYRPFEMVRDDLCYQNLPVTVVGMGAGVIYSTLGGTHHTMEDISIASAIPNMRIIAPCDPLEVEAATRYCATQKEGPVYLRIGKAGEPVLTEDAAEPFEVGKLRYIWKGEDVAVVSFGVLTAMARDVAAALRDKGESVSLVSCHTVKPLDVEGMLDLFKRHKRLIVMEENVPNGGLTSLVKSLAYDVQTDCRVHGFTLQDEFIHCYGNHAELLGRHGLSAEQILAKVA